MAMLIRYDQERIAFGAPRHARLAWLGLIGLGLALFVLFEVVAIATDADGVPKIVRAVVEPSLQLLFLFMASLVLTGCFMSLWVDEFHLDCLRQWYTRRRGLFPFARSWSGTYSDFDHLVMKRYELPSRGQKLVCWVPFLVWKDPSRRDVPLALPTTPLSEAREHFWRQALQSLLEVPRGFWRGSSSVPMPPREAVVQFMLDMAGRLNVAAFDETGKQMTQSPREAVQGAPSW